MWAPLANLNECKLSCPSCLKTLNLKRQTLLKGRTSSQDRGQHIPDSGEQNQWCHSQPANISHFSNVGNTVWQPTVNPEKSPRGLFLSFSLSFSCLNKGEADHGFHTFEFWDKVNVSSGYLSTILFPSGRRGARSTVITLHSRLRNFQKENLAHMNEAENCLFFPVRTAGKYTYKVPQLY